ncbi:hypothetical protein EJB05_08944, partial [Eragrostis curvula]
MLSSFGVDLIILHLVHAWFVAIGWRWSLLKMNVLKRFNIHNQKTCISNPKTKTFGTTRRPTNLLTCDGAVSPLRGHCPATLAAAPPRPRAVAATTQAPRGCTTGPGHLAAHQGHRLSGTRPNPAPSICLSGPPVEPLVALSALGACDVFNLLAEHPALDIAAPPSSGPDSHGAAATKLLSRQYIWPTGPC